MLLRLAMRLGRGVRREHGGLQREPQIAHSTGRARALGRLACLLTLALDPRELSTALAAAETTLEFDAASRAYSGQRETRVGDRPVRLVPLRAGTRQPCRLPTPSIVTRQSNQTPIRQ